MSAGASQRRSAASRKMIQRKGRPLHQNADKMTSMDFVPNARALKKSDRKNATHPGY
jgi:hypothetical protein